MRLAVKRETPSSKEFLDMSVFGYCPLEASAKDSVLCEREKILVVFWRIPIEARFDGGVCHSSESAENSVHS